MNRSFSSRKIWFPSAGRRWLRIPRLRRLSLVSYLFFFFFSFFPSFVHLKGRDFLALEARKTCRPSGGGWNEPPATSSAKKGSLYSVVEKCRRIVAYRGSLEEDVTAGKFTSNEIYEYAHRRTSGIVPVSWKQPAYAPTSIRFDRFNLGNCGLVLCPGTINHREISFADTCFVRLKSIVEWIYLSIIHTFEIYSIILCGWWCKITVNTNLYFSQTESWMKRWYKYVFL